jgi:hypothetical protein
MSLPEWTDEELQQWGKNLFWVFSLLPLVYFKQQGQSIADYGKFVGEFFAPGWEKGKGALEIARQQAFNYASVGATLISLEGDEKRATVVIDIPIKEIANNFNLSLEEVDLFVGDNFKPIAVFLDMTYTSQYEGERWTWEFSY